jgi:hypothetical protein
MAAKQPGQKSIFRGKVRAPVSLTLTPEHHQKVEKATERLGVTRADLIGLLIEQYADRVQHVGNHTRDRSRVGGRPPRVAGVKSHERGENREG